VLAEKWDIVESLTERREGDLDRRQTSVELR
jgi:hypothetical protein